MENREDIIASIKNDVLDFQRQLREKMLVLAQEGLLNEKDKVKIEHNMQATVEALSSTVTAQSYNQAFTKEWILRIAQSYEEEILKQVKQIENRRYTDKLIADRIQRIIMQHFADNSSIEDKGLIAVEIKKLEKQLWEDIHGISQKHSRRSQLIETWLQEFEANIRLLVMPPRFLKGR